MSLMDPHRLEMLIRALLTPEEMEFYEVTTIACHDTDGKWRGRDLSPSSLFLKFMTLTMIHPARVTDSKKSSLSVLQERIQAGKDCVLGRLPSWVLLC
jgi:hypothetical protein